MKVKKSAVIAALAVLIAGQGALNRANYPLWVDNFAPKTKSNLSGLGGDQLLFALAGFREMLAGILWVRADAFFETGNYDAVLPIIRLVTMLDPNQIDVYATGMWHIGYNFTDEQSRSDRRYLSSALALGAEGARNNPETYELFFETGWLWYHKIDDNYDKAVYWWEEAIKREDMQAARKNMLANAYIRDGKLEKALALYESLLADAEKRVKENPDLFEHRQNRDTIESNLDNFIVRMAQRGNFARKGGYYDEWKYDTNPPFDVGFSAKITIPEPKVLQVEGSWNVQPIGTRIRLVLRDKNFPHAIPAGAIWDSDPNVRLEPPIGQTFMQEGLFVRNQAFDETVRMDRDPTMYPFTTDTYLVEFYYNPRSAPPHIQDKFGYNGEGMTDKRFLSTTAREGQRVLYCAFEITQDMILRQGKWFNEVPVLATKNFVETGLNFEDEIIPSVIDPSKTDSTDLIPVPTKADDGAGG